MLIFCSSVLEEHGLNKKGLNKDAGTFLVQRNFKDCNKNMYMYNRIQYKKKGQIYFMLKISTMHEYSNELKFHCN